MQKYISVAAGVVMASSLFIPLAMASTIVTVTPANPQGWSTADTRPGGAVNFVSDPSSPYPDGALELTTNASTTAKAQYLTSASTSLSDVTQLSYYAKQISGPSLADPSYQLLVDLGGSGIGFTTFVYEPYEQASSTITPGAWQQWDVAAGKFWSSRSFTDGGSCSVTAGHGGAPFYTLDGIKVACPNAVVVGYGVNIGSNNPSYDVYADALNFNGTIYDFQLNPVNPTDMDQCKKGGWMNFTNPSFKNQGQCVSFVEKNK